MREIYKKSTDEAQHNGNSQSANGEVILFEASPITEVDRDEPELDTNGQESSLLYPFEDLKDRDTDMSAEDAYMHRLPTEHLQPDEIVRAFNIIERGRLANAVLEHIRSEKRRRILRFNTPLALEVVESFIEEFNFSEEMTPTVEVVKRSKIEKETRERGEAIDPSKLPKAVPHITIEGDLFITDEMREQLDAYFTLGEDERKRVIEKNLRLVIKPAVNYARFSGREKADLIQEGNMGLVKAVEKFEYARGYTFGTYAVWWIKQAIRRSIAESGNPKIPEHVNEIIVRVLKKRNEYEVVNGRPPSIDSLEVLLPYSRETIETALAAYGTQHALSLQTPVGDAESTLADFVADKTEDVAEQALNSHHVTEQREGLEEAFGNLDPREKRVLELRFGLDGNEPKTLDEITCEIGVSRERVRQLETVAIKKLRSPHTLEHLRQKTRVV